MEAHTFFLQLLAVLLSARIFAELAVRLNTPPVIGELMAGVLIGPSLLGWVSASQTMQLLAEIGIILLLFEVGLETDVRRLARSGIKATIVAISGFFLPLILGFITARWIFDLSLITSLFIGGTLTATSIGITVRVLTDLNRQSHAEGQTVLGAAVVDDVMGVVLLAVLYEISQGGEVDLTNAAKVFIFVGVFFIAAPIAAKAISLIIKHFESVTEIPGLVPTAIISLVLFFAYLAHYVGAPSLLGGFAAGLALSRRFFFPFGTALHADPVFAGRIESQMKPLVHLFTPIFFVTVGLSIDLQSINWSSSFIWIFSLSLLVVAVIGKLIGAFLISENNATRFVIGLCMIPRGEIGLIFAELGRVSNVLNNETYTALVLVIALTTLLPPILLKAYYQRYAHLINRGAD